MSLRHSAVRGAKWGAISSVAIGAVQFLQLAVLARLLSPGDFGLMAMVMAVMSFAQIFLDGGMGYAIVQRQDISREQLSSAYWLNIIVGIILFIVMIVITPVIVAIVHEKQLRTLILAAALLLIIGPVGAQYQLLLQRNLAFGLLVIIDTAAALTAAVVSVGAAFVGLGVTSLILGQLCGALCSSISLATVGWRRWRPMWRLRRADVDGLLAFGLYQMGERVLNFANSRLDQVLIGIFIGPHALGLYSLAWNLVLQPVTRLNPVLTRVAFPVFSLAQEEPERLKHGFLTLTWSLAAVNAPILIGCAAIAPFLVPVVYGEQWQGAIMLVQLLSGVGLVRAIINPIGSLLLSKGRADLSFAWNLGLFCVQVPAIFGLIYFGGIYVLAAGLLGLYCFYLIANYLLLIRPLLGPCGAAYAGSLMPLIGNAMVMGMLVLYLSMILAISAPAMLVTQIAVGCVVYVILTLCFQRTRVVELAITVGISAPTRWIKRAT